MDSPEPGGRLARQLPAPFQDAERGASARDFLLAFERLLLGPELADEAERSTYAEPVRDRPFRKGLDELIGQLADYIDPLAIPAGQEGDFLPWLARWLAYAWRSDLKPDRRADFIARLHEFYAIRGTSAALIGMLDVFTGRPAATTINVQDEAPGCLFINLNFNSLLDARNNVDRLTSIARSIIRKQLPAHVRYVLIPSFPSFQLGERALGAHGTEFYAQICDRSKRVGTMILGQAVVKESTDGR